jgi:hypothetical protein
MEPPGSATRSRDGPSLLTLALAYTLLELASVAALALLRRDGSPMSVLNPFGPPEQSRLFFAANPGAIRAGGFLCFASAVPLGAYAATLVSRLHSSGARDAGSYVAFAGGMAASAGLAAAGVFLWLLSVPEASASVPVARVLHFLVFLCGGPAFAVGMGLLAAGASSSVQFATHVPRWLAWLGLTLGVTGALSTLGLLSVLLTVPIPITRLAGFVWLIAVAAKLSRVPSSGPHLVNSSVVVHKDD